MGDSSESLQHMSKFSDFEMLSMLKLLLKLRVTLYKKVIEIRDEPFRDFLYNDIYCINFITYHLSRRGLNGLHIYHIIKPSKWPALMSIVLFGLAVGFVVCVLPESGNILSKINIFSIILAFFSIFYFWCFDIMNESGEHNYKIKQGIKFGMILFILSEFMFFFAFFWAYLNASVNPSIFIGHIWPPFGQSDILIESISLPFLNTVLLLSSGFCVTLAHKFSSILIFIDESLVNLSFSRIFQMFDKKKAILAISYKHFMQVLLNFNYIRHALRLGLAIALALTILLAIIFTNIQVNEYLSASFNISDGIYASCFYLMTGFHGIHVIVGTIFLIVCFLQVNDVQYFYKEITGLECAIWYWHFVDVVWLFLYIIVYLIADNAYQREAKVTLIERLNNLDRVFNNFAHGAFEVKATGFASKNQKYFNFPATTAMSEIIWLHDYIMFFIIVIFFVVLALFYGILHDYTTVVLYEKYIKFAQYRIDMGGSLFRGDKGKGFSKTEDILTERGEPRSKTY